MFVLSHAQFQTQSAARKVVHDTLLLDNREGEVHFDVDQTERSGFVTVELPCCRGINFCEPHTELLC